MVVANYYSKIVQQNSTDQFNMTKRVSQVATLVERTMFLIIRNTRRYRLQQRLVRS